MTNFYLDILKHIFRIKQELSICPYIQSHMRDSWFTDQVIFPSQLRIPITYRRWQIMKSKNNNKKKQTKTETKTHNHNIGSLVPECFQLCKWTQILFVKYSLMIYCIWWSREKVPLYILLNVIVASSYKASSCQNNIVMCWCILFYTVSGVFHAFHYQEHTFRGKGYYWGKPSRIINSYEV